MDLTMTTDQFPPAKSCDTHLHVVGPQATYPLVSKRAFTPPDAPLAELIDMHQRLGIERLVLIQTSVFGYDNRCMLDSLAKLSERARGVVMVPDTISTHELDDMHQLGVRGIRINITEEPHGLADVVVKIASTVKLCQRNDWHLQIFVRADKLTAIVPTLANLPIDCVIDHFGLIPPQDVPHAAENALVELLEAGRTWVKISGAYRVGNDANNDFYDPKIGAMARRFYRANPERVVWGTDWPHTPVHGAVAVSNQESPYRDIDPANLLEELRLWFNNTYAMEQILVHNPAKLYAF
jgi:predicted TIM-barrel fold metal-dependent hydrolase